MYPPTYNLRIEFFQPFEYMYLILKIFKKKLSGCNLSFLFNLLNYAFLICLGLIVGIYSLWKARQGIGDTDTAFFLEVIDNTLRSGLPTTFAVRAYLNIAPYLDMAVAQYCSSDFSAVMDSSPANILLGHANFIVYPLSVISYFFGPEFTAAVANTFSFVGLPLVAYVYLRKTKVPSYIGFLFMIALCAHPAWRISAEGWFYFDRMFMPLALFYALTLHGAIASRHELTGLRMLGTALIVIVGASIHERAALLLLMFSLSSLILYVGAPKRNIRFVLVVSLSLCVYLSVYLLFQKNIDNQAVYKSFYSFDTIIENVFQPGLIKLIYFNLIFFSLAIVFQWRVALLALIMLLPNIIVTMHGLEKDGWFTHYHSFYFPFIVYAGLIGIVSLSEWCQRERNESVYQWLCRLCPSGFLILVACAMCFQNPYGKIIRWDFEYINEGLMGSLIDLYVVPSQFSSNLYEAARADKLVALIHPTASVAQTPPFNTWKLLKNKNLVSVFPVGLGRVNYLLLYFEKNEDNLIQFRINSLSKDYREMQK
ncbi:hypothetical protein QN374_16290, partial [Herbaspirillum sp. RTI4]